MARITDFPPTLRASTEHPDVVYTRADDYYAVQGSKGEKGAKGTEARGAQSGAAVMSLNEGAITVHQGKPTATRSVGNHVSAVYARDSALAVPTGQVFVRFATSVQAESRREQLRKVGYEIAQMVSYAPNAAWLKSAQDDVADALNNIPKLEAMESVENVEPQLLTPRSLRA